MSLISKLLRRGAASESKAPTASTPFGAHEAIRLARQGKLPISDMINCLVASNLHVPLDGEPELEGNMIRSWKPATVSKGDGSKWLVAFTDSELSTQFVKQYPAFGYGLDTGARWVLTSIPPQHGLVVNLGYAEINFEWAAEGLTRYRREVLGCAY
jgi:hypothetical protein